MMVYHGFIDGSSRHTQGLASAAWVIYSPTNELITSGGRCLGPVTNNVAKYQSTIGLMAKALSSGIPQLIVYLDSQLVVSQTNGIYSIRDPMLLCLFQRIRLLEMSFTYIRFYYSPR